MFLFFIPFRPPGLAFTFRMFTVMMDAGLIVELKLQHSIVHDSVLLWVFVLTLKTGNIINGSCFTYFYSFFFRLGISPLIYFDSS